MIAKRDALLLARFRGIRTAEMDGGDSLVSGAVAMIGRLLGLTRMQTRIGTLTCSIV